jgi:hypothetical protein
MILIAEENLSMRRMIGSRVADLDSAIIECAEVL